MIPLLPREAVRALAGDAVARLGLPSVILMENAGRGAFEAIRRHFPDRLERVVLVGGAGQNGGDAWVVARHLWLLGVQPKCVLLGDRSKVKGDAAVNLGTLEKLHGLVTCVGEGELSQLTAAVEKATLLVDGIFGTGLDRPVQGLHAAAIERLNASSAPRVALDIPSGVDSNTGAILGVAVRADLTVTFAAHKRGLHQHPGAHLAGELELASIGVPAPSSADYGVIEGRDVARWLPLRAADTHKGKSGHVLVIAGAPGRSGAALLSGLGALRAGAGLVTLCPRNGARGLLDAKVIELMTDELPADPGAALAHVKKLMERMQAAVIGPGLGTDDAGATIARRLALELAQPAVLDADAITAFAGKASELRKAGGPRVITPHPAEAARLLGSNTEAVQAQRYAAAARLAADSGSVAVLKGARTVIAAPDGRARVCSLDVPALAVGGTGDVLSGTIGGLLPQLDPFDAATCGVYLHARAGELAAITDRGLFAREVADALPRALAACRG
jgi:NAD(P)H-hydrate epimerase